jgi:hypothetical protein
MPLNSAVVRYSHRRVPTGRALERERPEALRDIAGLTGQGLESLVDQNLARR